MDDLDKTENRGIIEEPKAQKKLVFLLASIVFFSVLNGSMFNVSIPDIAQQFALLPSQVSWVISGYVIVFAVGSVTYGRLADAYPIKNLILIGLVLFNVGSLIGFLSNRYPMLIVGRVVQALGSGAIPALGMLITTRYFPVAIRGRVLGTIASTVAFGAGIGPILGGFITATFHWRYLFLLSLVTLLTLPSFRRHLPDHREGTGGFDILGALLVLCLVGSLLLFITLAVWWLLPTCLILTLVFAMHIHRTDTPFLSPSLFKNRAYRSMIVVAFLSLSTVFGMLFMTPLMLRGLNGLGAGNIGMVMFPGAMIAAVAGTIGGRFVDRKGAVPVIYTGMTALMIGHFHLSVFAGLSPWVVALNLILCYIGFTLLQSSFAHMVSSTLPADQMGAGMGMYNLFFFMAGALSTACTGKMLDISEGQSPLNPLAIVASSGPYSNLYLLLAAVVFLALFFFFAVFRKSARHDFLRE
ncbi:MAG: MFS transporter [Deltaproteobacteria bacterium]|nr:MFS transporter [Deltaproteobacteria bacterium]MBW1815766.1 MFS transporter [Deltaproteobacteria bacterium]